jgi:hypothetical protein
MPESTRVEYYDGNGWTTLEDVAGNTAWEEREYYLPTRANGKNNFQLRFKTVHNGSKDYAYLDDVSISARQ